MRKLLFLVFISNICLIIGCNTTNIEKNAHKNCPIYKDLDSINVIKKLTVLINYGPTSYFIYKGQAMGFEYELLKKYTKEIGVRLEVVPIINMDSIVANLNKGVADIVAANLTITEERLKKVNFTNPILITKQVLIQSKPENWRKLKKHRLKKLMISSALELKGKEITVRKGSSFYARLKSLSNEIGGRINIQTISGEYSVEELIEKVALHQITYTIADKNIATVNQWLYPNIDVSLEISSEQNIAMACRKNSPQLLQSFNDWLITFQQTKYFKLLYNKYFKNQRLFKKRINHKYYTLKSGDISPFDKILKKQAKKIGWDWELLASIIYQESHFNNKARGWGGSFGLMQFMPKTGAKFGVDTTSSAYDNIVAGVKYLKYLDNFWTPIIADTNQRIRFVLASYNIGPGHILDARRLAEKYGKNPFVWDENVDFFVLNKAKAKYYKDPVVRNGYCKGYITYNYVNEIIIRYQLYKKFVKRTASNEIRFAQK